RRQMRALPWLRVRWCQLRSNLGCGSLSVKRKPDCLRRSPAAIHTGALETGESASPRGWQTSAMTLELINPPDLPTPNTYTQVVVATGSRLVFVAGQEPEDAEGRLVGPGDLAVQARQAFANLGRALTAAGAEADEVARITI